MAAENGGKQFWEKLIDDPANILGFKISQKLVYLVPVLG